MPPPSEPLPRRSLALQPRATLSHATDRTVAPSDDHDGVERFALEQLGSEPPPGHHTHGNLAATDDAAGNDHIPSVTFGAQRPVVHMGLVVDPDAAEEGDIPLEQLSSEPPPMVQRRVRRTIPEDPTLRPHTAFAMPSTSEMLDPARTPPPIPRPAPPPPSATWMLSSRMTAVFGALFGLVGIVAVFAMLNRVSPQTARASAAPKSTSTASVASAKKTPQAPVVVPDFEDEGPALPGPWRVSSLSESANVRTIKGVVGLEPFVNTLQTKGLSKTETYRVLSVFKSFEAFKRLRKADQFVAAIDRSTGKVMGFELEVSPLEVYQARQNDEGLLVGSRLDMQVASRTRTAAVRITSAGLSTDLRAGQLRESVAAIIDKAFDGRASVASMPKGSSLRVIVQERTALGRFADYEHVEALEYVSSKQDTKPMRIYRFKDGGRYGYFNQDAKEPYRGGWRMPCPGAPITSHFNPKRFHPVLKRIQSHEGTDFGVPTGTPIHATSFGTVEWIGPRGPAGNLVIIRHPGNIDSYYMHMHRFASGLKKGDKVETFQVIGYVGNTGRSTGPHLHFGIKKNDVWIDPMSLKLDGDRLVSASVRSEFDAAKAEFDRRLDAIELPPSPDVPDMPDAPPVEEGQQEEPGSTAPYVPSTPNEGLDDDDELEPGTVHGGPPDDPL